MDARYPDAPGYVARDTSQAAAEAIAPKALSLRDQVLAFITYCPATCAEIEHALRLSHQTASARVRELGLKALIVDSGQRRATDTGRKAIVWKAVSQ